MLRNCISIFLPVVALVLALSPRCARAQPPAPADKPVSFINEVAPILKENCLGCHDAKKRKGKFDMSTYESLRKGSDREEVIVAGKPDESPFLDRLKAKDNSRMPPKEAGDQLPVAKIALIERWIAQGAKLDAGIAPKAELMRELRIRWKPPEPSPRYKYPATITALAFTPGNKKLVVGGQHELLLWDIAEAKLEKRIRTRAERIYGMAFLPDGKLAVAGGRPGQEGSVCIYDLQASAARSLNGVALLDGVNDPKVLVRRLLDIDDAVLCLAVSPDGKKLASGGSNDRLVHVWDLTPGPGQAKLEQTIENHADWILGLAFTADGKRLLTCSRDKTAKVWDLAAKESTLTFPDHQNPVYGLTVKPDGKIAISAGEDNQIRYWNTTGEAKQILASGGHGGAIFRLLLHPKQPLLISCSADGTVRTWNSDNGKVLHTCKGHTDWVYALAVSSDGELIASGSYNGEVKIWKTADGTLVKGFIGSPGFEEATAKGKKGK